MTLLRALIKYNWNVLKARLCPAKDHKLRLTVEEHAALIENAARLGHRDVVTWLQHPNE
jgi:hypothetical protein